MKKHCFILGTRPEIIKLYSLIRYCEEHRFDYFVIHTNQHYSENMDAVFFEQLRLPAPKYNLGIGSASHGLMTGKMLIGIEEILLHEMPDVVYVQGDTNSVMAGALAAVKIHGISIAHVEAGLRSYDRNMPEEANRIITDHISDYLFPPTENQKNILVSEGISEKKIHVVGNTVVDALMLVSDIIQTETPRILNDLRIEKDKYVLLTAHRPSNVDNEEGLRGILEGISEIAQKYDYEVVFPIHPRTASQLKKFGLEHLAANFRLIEPVGFIENLTLQTHAALIATDSGGIQEEACVLKKKTLILRNNTERPETLEVGGAVLVGNRKTSISTGCETVLNRDVCWYNPFGEGRSAEQILSITNE